MKIVVIGGSGLIGSKVVTKLLAAGHDVLAASPASGVNTVTGEGLAQALAGAQVVIDVANSPSFADQAVLEFFEQSGKNLLAAEALAGVSHHVALSVVGTDRLAESGYFRGKIAQEKLIRAGTIAYTIVQSTQFFEFLGGIVQASAVGDSVHLSPAFVQPIASQDVADAVVHYALGQPVNGVVEIAGPEKLRLSDLVQRYLDLIGDPRVVVADMHARYFGAELNDDTLLPGPNPRIGALGYAAWFAQSAASKPVATD